MVCLGHVLVSRSTMNKRIEVVPGKLTSFQAKAGIAVVSLFLVFGLVLGYVALREASWEEPDFIVAIGAFFAVWIAACVSIIVYFSRLLKVAPDASEDSLAEIRVRDDRPGTDFETRLRRLGNLKKDGLISDEEYQSKRAYILQEKW